MKKYFFEKIVEVFKVYLDESLISQTKIWNIGTSTTSMIDKFKNNYKKELKIVDIKKNQKNNNEYVLNNGFCETGSTYHQYFRVGIFLNFIKTLKEKDFILKSASSLIDELQENKNIYEINDEILKSEDNCDFLLSNFEEIITNIRELLSCNNYRIKKDLLNFLYTNFLITIKFSNNPLIKKYELMHEKNLEQYSEQINNVVSKINRDKKLIPFFEKMFFSDNSFNDFVEIEKEFVDNEKIGLLGETIFSRIARDSNNIEKYLKVDKDFFDLTNEEINSLLIWESINNKYSEYDFKNKNYFFEVKTSLESFDKKKINFHLSYNEFISLQKNFENYKIIKISNISQNLYDKNFSFTMNNEIYNVELRIFSYEDIKNNFKLLEKGYYVNEK
ncbi:hypothetical protein CG001_01595 [Mesoplasma coleopterae]|uniref:DUF3883 domain-containing protein n=1 Tax=Mesoplasma coleopterae TaxID=324078 RepID=UPI000D0476C8|nr:DUF3883 domain-containing protein [Mesoplasma coleopterae]AVN62337.1 hypothetical protein CG001_01595 [Mesoplasma coleopterae]